MKKNQLKKVVDAYKEQTENLLQRVYKLQSFIYELTAQKVKDAALIHELTNELCSATDANEANEAAKIASIEKEKSQKFNKIMLASSEKERDDLNKKQGND